MGRSHSRAESDSIIAPVRSGPDKSAFDAQQGGGVGNPRRERGTWGDRHVHIVAVETTLTGSGQRGQRAEGMQHQLAVAEAHPWAGQSCRWCRRWWRGRLRKNQEICSRDADASKVSYSVPMSRVVAGVWPVSFSSTSF